MLALTKIGLSQLFDCLPGLLLRYCLWTPLTDFCPITHVESENV